MLSEADKERLRAEEKLKAEIRAELSASSARAATTGRFSWLAADNFRWLVTTLAIPLAVGIWGYYTNQIAEKDRSAREDVESTRRNVDLVIKLLPALNDDPGSRQRLNAIAVLRALEEKGALPAGLRAAFEQVKEEINSGWEPGKGYTTDAARKEAEAVADASPRLRSDQIEAGGASPVPSDIRGGRVFIQIFDESQRADATRLQAALRGAGIAVPGIENVAATAAKNKKPVPGGYDGNVLLVFHENETNLAQQIVRAGSDAGIDLTIRDRWRQKTYDNVPAGQLEIWFAKRSPAG